MKINNKYEIFDKVFIKIDKEQLEYTIIYILVLPNNYMYGIRDIYNTVHELYEEELSNEEDILQKIK